MSPPQQGLYGPPQSTSFLLFLLILVFPLPTTYAVYLYISSKLIFTIYCLLPIPEEGTRLFITQGPAQAATATPTRINFWLLNNLKATTQGIFLKEYIT